MIDPDQYDGFATPEELNLTPEEIQELRKMKAEAQTQELLNAANRIADGGVPPGKLIREGHQDPMTTRVRYEYAALLRELINQCGYEKDKLLLVNVRDILDIIEILENQK